MVASPAAGPTTRQPSGVRSSRDAARRRHQALTSRGSARQAVASSAKRRQEARGRPSSQPRVDHVVGVGDHSAMPAARPDVTRPSRARALAVRLAEDHEQGVVLRQRDRQLDQVAR